MKRLVVVGVLSLAAGSFVLGSCTENKSAINVDSKNSFLTSGDLVTMTDQMAASITSDPDVARVTAEKPMIIVMKPIQNETNEIIRQSEKELYVHRVRVLLSSKPALRNRFVFVLNREDYERLQREEGMSPEVLGPQEDRVQPEYALTGTFYAATNVTTKTRGDTYLCTFRLTKLADPNAGLLLWEDKYETAKHIKKELLD